MTRDELIDVVALLLGMSYAINRELFHHLNERQKDSFKFIEQKINETFYPQKEKEKCQTMKTMKKK